MFRARALFGALGATALAVYVALVVSDVIRVSGSGDGSFSPHGLDACVRYLGMDASEDIAIDHDNNIAFVSSNSLRSEFIPAVGMAPSFDHVGIYALNLASLPSPRAALTPLPLVDYPFASFRPVGISVYVDKRLNIRRLFVANRRRRFRKTAIMEALWPIYMPCVSVFDIVEAAGGLQLRHVASYEDPLIVSPNDVAAVGPDSFYVTNDGMFSNEAMRAVEMLALVPFGNVVYYAAGRGAQVAAKGLKFANGVQTSPQGDLLYVTETIGRRLNVYRVQPDNSLALANIVGIDSGLDNVSVDRETGDVYVGAHPDVLSLVVYMKDGGRPGGAPSQAFVVRDALYSPAVSELFRTHGNGTSVTGGDIAAASVVAVADRHLVIGSVADKAVLVCRRPGRGDEAEVKVEAAAEAPKAAIPKKETKAAQGGGRAAGQAAQAAKAGGAKADRRAR